MANGQDFISRGNLQIQVINIRNNFPIQNAKVSISSKGEPERVLEQLTTDSSGQTENISLPAPPEEYSLEPGIYQPYSEYDVLVEAEGFKPLNISGTEILAGTQAIQPAALTGDEGGTPPEDPVVIPDHTLFGNYPPKIAEAEVKPVNESGEIVLSRVVIPEYVIVHDGAPSDSSARNYWVRYRDYIKNVASSEIYSTWDEAAIRANVLAIQSFVLNRVFTEWYRNKGYNFTITNSTRYDQAFNYGRTIYEDISIIVDEMFTNYIKREGEIQPLFAQYCDGRNVVCPNWLSQWGSAALAEQGYSAMDILRYYYGDDIYLEQAESVSGVPVSFLGKILLLVQGEMM